MAPYPVKVRDPSPKTGTQQTMMTSESEAGGKTKAMLSRLRPLVQAPLLHVTGMRALPTRGAGLEEPTCEGLVPC